MTDLIQGIGAAARAYRTGQDAPMVGVREQGQGPSFAEMLENTARNTVETIHHGDRAAIAGMRGEMSTQQVVEAVMAMESAVRTSVAVRDKIVEASQEILRMSV